MEYVFFYLVSFVLIYLIYVFFLLRRKNSFEKIGNSLEVKYLVNKYKIDLQKHDLKNLTRKIALSNSFIISTSALVVCFIKHLIFKLLVGFVLLLPLIVLIYHLLGKSLKKKEGK